MKPNGKYFAIRALLLTLCAVSLLSALGSAETMHGMFTLPVEAHWGKLLLAPGEYEFTLKNDVSGRIITVRSKESGWSGMILSEGSSDLRSDNQTKLLLTKAEDGVYVRALCLGESGVMLNYGAPKAGKVVRLVQSHPATMASASGGQ